MPRPKGSRNKAPGPNKSKAIKAAALKVFCHYGYDGATLELVAEAAGTSRALVGKYFGGKQELAVLCLREFFTTFFAAVHKAHEKAASYQEGATATANLFILHRSEWRFVLAVLCTPSLAGLQKQIIPHYLNEAKSIVGNWAGDLQDPQDVADLAWLMTAGHFCYVVGGNVENYNNGRNNLLRHYVQPEKIL